MELELSIIISQVIAFLLMLWVLKLFAWKPFSRLLAARQRKIEEEFHALDLQKVQLQNLSDEYQQKLTHIDQEAKQKIDQALQQAEKLSKEISQDAHRQATLILENAKRGIDQEIAQAQQALKEKLVHLVMDATQKLVKESVDPEKEGEKIVKLIENLEIQ